MNARYYDPTIGRFLSEDPLGLGVGDLTLYSYAGNNPLVFVDPSGLCAVSGVSQFNSEMIWSGVKDIGWGTAQVTFGTLLLGTTLAQEAAPTGITQATGVATGAAGAYYLVNGIGSLGMGAGKISLGLQNTNVNVKNIPSGLLGLDVLFLFLYTQVLLLPFQLVSHQYQIYPLMTLSME